MRWADLDKEAAMHPWIATLADGTAHVWDAATMIVATFAAAGPRKPKGRQVELDRRTLKDIGVEPGAITWV